MTPRELFREFAAAATRVRARLERDLVLAWNIERFHRTKKLPTLKQELDRLSNKPQTPAEQLLVMRRISAQLGIPIRTVAHGQ